MKSAENTVRSGCGHVARPGFPTLVINADERWSHLIALDEELLHGGALLSEWCSFVVREADTALVSGARLAAILTAVSAIETHLRSEYAVNSNERLVDWIVRAPISEDLKSDIHALRGYRNRWVHVDAPWNDQQEMAA